MKSNKETIEEAANKYSNKIMDDGESYHGFKTGAKWQAERMYSEEEVFNLCREFAIFVTHNDPSYKKQQEWFDKVKKK